MSGGPAVTDRRYSDQIGPLPSNEAYPGGQPEAGVRALLASTSRPGGNPEPHGGLRSRSRSAL